MSQNALWSIIGSRKDQDTSLIDILKEIPVFAGMSKLELQQVAKYLHKRKYQDGELVFRENEAGNGMYIIQHGKVRILGAYESPDEVLYTTLTDHHFFGELALIDGAPRSATAIASADSVLFGFFKPDLLGLIDKNPSTGSKILLNLSSVLAERLRTMNTQIQALQTKLQNHSEATEKK